MRSLMTILVLLYSASSYAFLDKLFEKVGGAAAIASGSEDLLSELDENSSLMKDVKNVSRSANDVRELLTDIDGTVYDVNSISSSISATEETANKLHMVADKTRRARRLALRLGLITMDAPSAAAMEQIRTNTILDNYVNDRKEQELNAKEERFRKISFLAKRERQADKSLSSALQKGKERDKRSGTAFNPFTIPDGRAAVNDNIMMSIYYNPLSPAYGI